PERIADGAHPIAHAHRIRITQPNRREIQPAPAQANQGDVGERIATYGLAFKFASVVELDANVDRVLHHVIVGQQQTLGINDEPGAGALAQLLAATAIAPPTPPKEAIEEVVAEIVAH